MLVFCFYFPFELPPFLFVEFLASVLHPPEAVILTFFEIIVHEDETLDESEPFEEVVCLKKE